MNHIFNKVIEILLVITPLNAALFLGIWDANLVSLRMLTLVTTIGN